MIKYLNSFFEKKVDATGLSIFRMFYSVVLFFEVFHLFNLRHLIYDKIPFENVGEFDITYLFVFWLVILVFLFLGLFTRIITLLNYFLSVLIFSSAQNFQYHVFFSYIGVNFLILFIPLSRLYSIDNLIQKLKYSTFARAYVVDRKVLQINYIAPLFIGLGLVYLDSVFHKLCSSMWLNGLGVWLPSSLPMITWNNTSLLLNQKWLMLFLGYLVLFFEAVFIFVFFNKKSRIITALIGVFFHFGILIIYPIPFFALAMLVLYILLLPIKWWNYLFGIFKFRTPIYKFYYDLECPLCNKIVIIIKHFDIFNSTICLPVQGNYKNDSALNEINEDVLLINIHGVTQKNNIKVGFWAYVYLFKAMIFTYPLGLFFSLPGISHIGIKIYEFIAGSRLTERCTAENCTIPTFNQPILESQDFLISGLNKLAVTRFFWKSILLITFIGQLINIWYSPFVQKNFPKFNQVNSVVAKPFQESCIIYRNFLGITMHNVFLDIHFENYNHILKIEAIDSNGKHYLLPLIDNNGLPIKENSGVVWCNFSFNVVSSLIEKNKLETGILPYVKFFKTSSKNEYVRFNFYIKTIDSPSNWEKDFLNNQIKKPWIEVGDLSFINEQPKFNWNHVMDKILKSEK
jgi:hypothetical protein